LVWESRTSKIANSLRPACIEEAIDVDGAIHPDVVIKETARHVVGNLVDVLENRESVDLDHLGTSQARSVKTLRSKKVGKAVAKLFKDLDRIRGDENTFV
jgi:hypothetical protein